MKSFLIFASVGFILLRPIGAQTVKLGQADLTVGGMTQFEVPVLATEKRELEKVAKKPVEKIKVGLILPPGFDPSKPQTVMVTSATDDGDMTNANVLAGMKDVLLAKGWVGLSADGPIKPAEGISNDWHWACIASALAELQKSWPQSKQWSYAAGGFSGGAKRSGFTGGLLVKARLNTIGIFMGGCNGDTASMAIQYIKPNSAIFKKVPIFLSSGASDGVATPAQHKEVKSSMDRSGFKNVRLEGYAGGHEQSPEQVGMALDWFTEMMTKGSSTASGNASGSGLDQLKKMQTR